MPLLKSTLSRPPVQYFSTDHLKSDLRHASIKGGTITMLSQAAKFGLRTCSTVVLARLLTPEDYGLFGMAAVVTGFVQLFKDLGLSSATIQQAEINHKQVSTLFWINVALSAAITLVVVAIGPLTAWFYSEPRLIAITIAISISFLFGGLTVQHQALLRRQMRFNQLAIIEIISMAVGVLSAILAGLAGLGYWALVIWQVAQSIANAVAVWVVCDWRPGWPSAPKHVKPMLNYGWNLTGFNCVNYFSRNFDNLLIGRMWGAQQLGLYSKAYQLLLLPIQQINNPISGVAIPVLSRLQMDPAQYSHYYHKAILAITLVGMPLVGFMFASADQLIEVVLGSQWTEAALIFRLLAPAAWIGTFNVATGWVYQTLGRTDRQLQWGVISSVINVLLISISAQWGAVGVAAAYGLTRPLIYLFAVLHCYKGTWLEVRNLVLTLYRPAVASIGAAILIMALNRLILTSPGLLLLLDLCTYSLLYLVIWCVLPAGRETLMEMIQVLSHLKQGRKT